MIKYFALIITSLLVAVSTAKAQDPGTDDRGDEDYRWLYEILLPLEIREAQPAEAFKSFRVHLKDSLKNFPNPDQIRAENLNIKPKIQGTMLYVGVVQKKYVYDVAKDAKGVVHITVKVHFKNATAQDWIDFDQRAAIASEMWNQSAIPLDFKYQFHFEMVRDQNNSHFSVTLQDTTRGPYDTYWGRNWTPNVIAHEVGHMLGLGDEYQTLSGVFDCYMGSLMCSAWYGSLMQHHYYFVLRRLVQH
jgi:hypothetical protein